MAVLVQTQDYEQIQNEIAVAIRRRRSDCLPWEAARAILRYDTPDHTHVVGIDNAAAYAALYHCDDRYVIAVEITPDGLDDGGYEIASFQHGSTIESWISTTYPDFAWIHPRYR